MFHKKTTDNENYQIQTVNDVFRGERKREKGKEVRKGKGKIKEKERERMWKPKRIG